MPQRSNSFQRLILLIEASLVPHNARVIESLILRDLTTGETREIDVAIEIPVGQRIIRIALECRDHRRPAGIQWIDEIAGKYTHLPVDRIVAVSHSGFTNSARKKASILNIDLLTTEDISEFDWEKLSSANRFICVLSIRYEWKSIILEPPRLTASPYQHLESIGALSTIYLPTGESKFLNDLIHDFVSKPGTRNSLTKMWLERPAAEIEAKLPLEGSYCFDLQGNKYDLSYAIIVLTGQTDELLFEMHASKYGMETVAHGETSLDGHPVSLVIVERSGEVPHWLWYVNDSDKKHPWRLSTPPIFSTCIIPRTSFIKGRDSGVSNNE